MTVQLPQSSLEMGISKRHREPSRLFPARAGGQRLACPESPLTQLSSSLTDLGTSGQTRGRDGSAHTGSQRVGAAC